VVEVATVFAEVAPSHSSLADGVRTRASLRLDENGTETAAAAEAAEVVVAAMEWGDGTTLVKGAHQLASADMGVMTVELEVSASAGVAMGSGGTCERLGESVMADTGDGVARREGGVTRPVIIIMAIPAVIATAAVVVEDVSADTDSDSTACAAGLVEVDNDGVDAVADADASAGD
jgi:hypothetical protein